MVEVINKYETIFIVDATLADEQITGVVDKFKSLIAELAEIESIDEWGKRRLAYPINDINEGYYVLVNFNAKPEVPLELERVFNITDGILRNIVIKKEDKKKRS